MKIFYFSGTGNCLVVAKEMSQKLKADLISIPKVINSDKIQLDGNTMGIVFPSYIAPVAGLPQIIERFIRKIDNIKKVHIIAICTCGGYECVNALPSLFKLQKVIQSCGGKLAEAYSVRLPMNNLDYDHIPVPIERDSSIIVSRSKIKIDKIYKRIISKKGTKFKLSKRLFYALMLPMYKLMQKSVVNALKEKAKEPLDSKLECSELMPLTDNSIKVDENCKGCGICSKVCPVKNIVIVDGRPQFQHRCEMCFACDEWCPSGAIHHWSRAEGIKYHHPDAKLSDMF